MISYATPSHLLQPDKLSTQTVAPDLAWSLPRDINDAVQRDNDALINIQLFLFQPCLKFKHAATALCCPGQVREKRKRNRWAARVAEKSVHVDNEIRELAGSSPFGGAPHLIRLRLKTSGGGGRLHLEAGAFRSPGVRRHRAAGEVPGARGWQA